MSENGASEPHVFPEGRRPGEMLFTLMLLLAAGALLAALPWQTAWIPGKGLAAQPRLWPALSLGGVVLFAALHKALRYRIERTDGRGSERAEVLDWFRSLEYVGWYMVYVTAIPQIGYLLATIVFCVLLSMRVGYRGRALLVAGLFGLGIVLLFKSAMNVKIPSGAIYEYAPEGLRYILIRFF